MNIVYCLDPQYLKYTLHSVKTYKRHNPNAKFYFFITEPIKVLEKIGTCILYDKTLLAQFGKELCGYTHVSTTCFARFLIPMYLKDEERALYVDCDTVCKRCLKDFYNTDFKDHYIIGCQGINVSERQAQELKISFYINSGVLLFNIPEMLKDDYFQQILDRWMECIRMPKVFSADETIINYVFHKKIKLVSEKYNYCYKREYGRRAVPANEVAILHMTGANKKDFFWLK